MTEWGLLSHDAFGAGGCPHSLSRIAPRFQVPKSRFHFAFISPPPRSFPLFRRRSSIAPPTRPTHPKSGNPHPAPSTPRPPQRTKDTHRQHHQRREPSNPTARVSRQMPQGNRSCASCACRIAKPEWGGWVGYTLQQAHPIIYSEIRMFISKTMVIYFRPPFP